MAEDKKPETSPESSPEFKPKRAVVIIAQLIVVLLIGSFIGFQFQKQALENPDTRLEVAHKALFTGNTAVALKLFTGLAEAGNGMAQYWLGDMYENGLGVKRDIPIALGWYEKAAGKGIVQAETRLGEIYLTGQETIQDFTKARKWLQTAAAQGAGKAERLLGDMDSRGLGGTKDIVRAYAWYQLAILHGQAYATHLRDELIKEMTPTQITDGQSLARTLQAEIRRGGGTSTPSTPSASGTSKK